MDGLINNNIMGLTEDREGNIWASTFSGLSSINTTTLNIRNFGFRALFLTNSIKWQY